MFYSDEDFKNDLENNELLKRLLSFLIQYNGKKITRRMESFMKENWKEHTDVYFRFNYSDSGKNKHLYQVTIVLRNVESIVGEDGYAYQKETFKKSFDIWYSYSGEAYFDTEKVYKKYSVAYGEGAEQRILTWIDWKNNHNDLIEKYNSVGNDIEELKKKIKEMEEWKYEVEKKFVSECNTKR